MYLSFFRALSLLASSAGFPFACYAHTPNRHVRNPSNLHYSPSPRLPPAGWYLLPGLTHALVSDHEKQASDFTLSSLGPLLQPSSIAASRVPWGGIKWKEYENPFWNILHAQKHMINVLLRHGQSVWGIDVPLLLTVTKTTTRMRFTYFPPQWHHLW